MIFFDNASTTKLSPNSAKNLIEYSTEKYFNPSSNYLLGYENKKQIENVKKIICKLLNVKFDDNIIFTGSATEASNLAILGSYKPSYKKMIFSAGEHPSVYQTALSLKEKGATIKFINLQSTGEIDYEELEKSLDENVDFISIMLVNNETGAINDIKKISEIKNKKCPNALLHCDGVQGFGKLEIDLCKTAIDFFSISAHKLHGPKGLGVLYVKNLNKLRPIIWGGGQEYAIRSGTENLASIMAFKTALEELGNIKENFEKVRELNSLFRQEFFKLINPKIIIKILPQKHLSPYIINISIIGLKGEVLQHICEQKGLLFSTGSACSSKKSGNRVLSNLGYSKEEIVGNIRISFSNYTTRKEILTGTKILVESINELWEKVN